MRVAEYKDDLEILMASPLLYHLRPWQSVLSGAYVSRLEIMLGEDDSGHCIDKSQRSDVSEKASDAEPASAHVRHVGTCSHPDTQPPPPAFPNGGRDASCVSE